MGVRRDGDYDDDDDGRLATEIEYVDDENRGIEGSINKDWILSPPFLRDAIQKKMKIVNISPYEIVNYGTDFHSPTP